MSDIFEKLESIGTNWIEEVIGNINDSTNLSRFEGYINHCVVLKDKDNPEVYGSNEYYRLKKFGNTPVLNSVYRPCHGSLYKTEEVICNVRGIVTSVACKHLKHKYSKNFLDFIINKSLWKHTFYKRDSVNKIIERGFIVTKPNLNMTYTLGSLMIVRKVMQYSYIKIWNELVEAGVDGNQALILAAILSINEIDGENKYYVFDRVNQESFPFLFNKESLINICNNVSRYTIRTKTVKTMFKKHGRLKGVRGTVTEFLITNYKFDDKFYEFRNLLSSNSKIEIEGAFCFKAQTVYTVNEVKTALEAFLGDN